MKYKYLCRIILLIVSFLLIECGQDPLKADFERAEDLYKKEKYKGAALKFRDIATLNPQSEWAPKALFRSGTIYYLYLKDYEEAVEDFAYLIYYYPKHKLAFDAQVNIIEIYMDKLEDYPQAIVEIQRLLENYPNKNGMDQYQYMLAQCFYSMRDFDQTRLEYLILLDSYPDTELRPQVYYDIANTYFIEGSGKLDKAIEYYQKVIDEYPESDLLNECNFYIAASLEEKGELYEALIIYEELLGVYQNPRVIELRIEGVKDMLEKMGSPAPNEAYGGLGVKKDKDSDKEEGESTGDVEGEGDNGTPTGDEVEIEREPESEEGGASTGEERNLLLDVK